MRFKLESDTHVIMYLSKRETEKYQADLFEVNMIEDEDLPFKVESGTYNIKINETPIVLEVDISKYGAGHRATVKANNVLFTVDKLHEITKYDLYRATSQNLAKITE